MLLFDELMLFLANKTPVSPSPLEARGSLESPLWTAFVLDSAALKPYSPNKYLSNKRPFAPPRAPRGRHL
jgi:hypothetical protein